MSLRDSMRQNIFILLEIMAAQGGLNVNLRKFVMKSIPQDAVAVFIGRRRTGKSTIVRDLLFHHQDMPMGCVISGTEESNGFFKKIVPPMFIHGEYNPVILANFVKRQKLVMQKIQQDKERGVANNLDPRAFLLRARFGAGAHHRFECGVDAHLIFTFAHAPHQ